MIKIDEIAKTLGVDIKNLPDEIKKLEINNISTDTRTIQKGDFYIPLKGENFDGEKFIDKAIEAGAVGYLGVNINSQYDITSNVVGIKVDNTKEAYLKLANYYRKKLSPKVIMITGSSGKTTTKELVASVVSQKFNTIKTPLNHNNEIGLCQTLFSITEQTEVVIIEAGMRGLGEIELISKYAQPDISVISNVGTAHIGRLGSRENIAKAKCEITKYQNPNGILIAHNDDLIKSTVQYCGEKLYYSLDDVEFIKKEIGHSVFKYKNEEYELNIEGDYNVENSLSAINVGKYLGIDYNLIRKGLAEYKPIEKRWELEKIGGYNIINDSYNANPDSMKATLNTVLELYNDIVIVLGDMGELGENERVYHREVGEFINTKIGTKNNTLQILTVGSLAKEISDEIKLCYTKNFENNDEVSDYLRDNIELGKTIFLKASRSMKFEEILTKLRKDN